MLPMPEVKCVDAWRANDYIILGSSGFWEMQRNLSKTTIEKVNLMFQKRMQNAIKKTPHKAEEYGLSLEIC